MFFKFWLFCRKKTRVSLSVVAALLPCVAGASPFVGGASFTVELLQGNLGSRTFFLPGTYVLGGVSTTISGLSGGTLAGVARPGGNSGSGTIAYGFAVVGPQDGVTVPVWVTFALNVAASGTIQGLVPDSGASAALSISTLGESLQFRVGAGELAQSPARTNLSSTVPFTMVSGQPGFVVEQTVVEAGPQLDAAASAFLDPFIFIDPGFLSANPGFSVIVSDGIDNAPRAVGGVPEPATLAPVGLALVVAMGLGRRRRLQRSTKVAMLISA